MFLSGCLFRSGVSRITHHFERARLLHSPVPYNLQISSNVYSAKYSVSAKAKLPLSDDAKKRFIEFMKKEFGKGRSSASDLVGQSGYEEISRLLSNRSMVEESIKSLEDLGEQDAEMKKLGEEEYSGYLDELELLDDELLDCILNNVGRENCNNVILEITTGVGGQESMLFAKEMLDMYTGHFEYLGFDYELIHQDSTSCTGGIRHVSIAVSGNRALEILRHEGGVHRVQRIPATEKSGRIHTSTVSVALLPQPSDVEVVIKDKDLRIETKKATGPGGQSVNTTDSAVRMTHLPTGISVECQTERSQIKNRRIALLRLRAVIYEKQLKEQRDTSDAIRKKQFGLGTRNEKIRTYNFNQDRITDHRIPDGTRYNLKGFLQGGHALKDLQLELQRDMQMKILQEILQRSTK